MPVTHHRAALLSSVDADADADVSGVGDPISIPNDQDPSLCPRHWRFHLVDNPVVRHTCVSLIRSLGPSV